ncbi:hypothetical protein CH275_16465 [Rhodococcus sp. 06-235-1A]|uniref:nucleotide sugar dehydrogenase n=1 Tax=Rhodococcus sp. 06-235-1A TaxID=2022508 RepID=UPI000B9B1F7E|nr:nucleotide sugar dehydrogenase [Rhodococcus sp. 06-235-1A]OZD03371.1 hypothetical protein CH275_16465 [Rhodococcus sp. 06-235-1A]
MTNVIAVCGTWHLGTAVCAGLLNRGCTLALFDEDSQLLNAALNGRAPTGEPGVSAALAAGADQMHSTTTLENWAGHKLCVLAYDTQPDEAGLDVRLEQAVHKFGTHSPPDAVLIVMSQLRAGTHERWSATLPERRTIVYVPENLRLGSALVDFTNPTRLIVGATEEQPALAAVNRLFPDQQPTLVLPIEAELIKHATNAYLALCITFANELGALAAHLGANPRVVTTGLKADPRVSPNAPLRPGEAFSGATLRRDLLALTSLGQRAGRSELFAAVLNLNERHAFWSLRATAEAVGGLDGKRIAVMGLTYKPGVATLRDSLPLRIVQRLTESGAHAVVFDPAADQLSADLCVERVDTATEAVTDADAVLVLAALTEVINLDWTAQRPAQAVIIDGCSGLDPEKIHEAGWQIRTIASPEGGTFSEIDGR